jgi:hypothetical protein
VAPYARTGQSGVKNYNVGSKTAVTKSVAGTISNGTSNHVRAFPCFIALNRHDIIVSAAALFLVVVSHRSGHFVAGDRSTTNGRARLTRGHVEVRWGPA